MLERISSFPIASSQVTLQFASTRMQNDNSHVFEPHFAPGSTEDEVDSVLPERVVTTPTVGIIVVMIGGEAENVVLQIMVGVGPSVLVVVKS